MSDQNGHKITFMDNSQRDQIVAIFQEKAEQLWQMLDGNAPAQEIVEGLHQAFMDHRDTAQAQIAAWEAMVKLYIEQRKEAYRRLEELEHDIRNGFEGSHNPAINGMIEQMREYVDETQRKFLIDRIADNLEIYDFDAEDLIKILTDDHTTLYMSNEHKQWIVEFMKHVGEWNRVQREARKKAQAG